MNILFLVSSFLIIFLFFSSTLLKQTGFYSSEQKNFCSYMEASGKIHNKLERYKYKSYEKKLQNAAKSEKKKAVPVRRVKEYLSPRFSNNLPLAGKWNLLPLIIGNQSSGYLESATADFLENIYGHTNFWKEGQISLPSLKEDLVAFFKRKKMDKNPPERLSDLFPSDPLLQNVFYKMLKGSGAYSLAKKEGYPPLEDVFRLDSESKETLSLPYGSYPGILAFFGKDIAEKIVKAEMEKWEEKGGYYSVTKSELTDLMGTSIGGIQELEPYLGTSYKKTKLSKVTCKEGNRAFIQVFLP